ncbi:MAG: OmpA family protein, partial [Bacteroidetes bacterium]
GLLAPGTCVSLSFAKAGYFTYSRPTPLCYEQLGEEQLAVYLAPYRLPDGQVPEKRHNPQHAQNSFAASTQRYADDQEAIPYLLNVYYDLGRTSVRPEAIAELHKLHRLLVDNPELRIEVSAHTDAQGSKDFNRRLSQRRADAIAQWLYRKGIAPERIVAKGYGELRLTNHCSDGVPCTESQHQANRRTEFRVLTEQLGQSN